MPCHPYHIFNIIIMVRLLTQFMVAFQQSSYVALTPYYHLAHPAYCDPCSCSLLLSLDILTVVGPCYLQPVPPCLSTCHAALQGAELLNTLQSVSHIAVLIEIGSCNFYLAIWSDHNGMHHLHYLVGPKTFEIQKYRN